MYYRRQHTLPQGWSSTKTRQYLCKVICIKHGQSSNCLTETLQRQYSQLSRLSPKQTITCLDQKHRRLSPEYLGCEVTKRRLENYSSSSSTFGEWKMSPFTKQGSGGVCRGIWFCLKKEWGEEVWIGAKQCVRVSSSTETRSTRFILIQY